MVGNHDTVHVHFVDPFDEFDGRNMAASRVLGSVAVQFQQHGYSPNVWLILPIQTNVWKAFSPADQCECIVYGNCGR